MILNEFSVDAVETGMASKTFIHLVTFFYTPSSELFKEFYWQTFPERVTYQKAILMYIIISNICPDYLKNYVSYTSDVSCRDTR